MVQGRELEGKQVREGVRLRRWEASNELKSFVPLKGDDTDWERKKASDSPKQRRALEGAEGRPALGPCLGAG